MGQSVSAQTPPGTVKSLHEQLADIKSAAEDKSEKSNASRVAASSKLSVHEQPATSAVEAPDKSENIPKSHNNEIGISVYFGRVNETEDVEEKGDDLLKKILKKLHAHVDTMLASRKDLRKVSLSWVSPQSPISIQNRESQCVQSPPQSPRGGQHVSLFDKPHVILAHKQSQSKEPSHCLQVSFYGSPEVCLSVCHAHKEFFDLVVKEETLANKQGFKQALKKGTNKTAGNRTISQGNRTISQKITQNTNKKTTSEAADKTTNTKKSPLVEMSFVVESTISPYQSAVLVDEKEDGYSRLKELSAKSGGCRTRILPSSSFDALNDPEYYNRTTLPAFRKNRRTVLQSLLNSRTEILQLESSSLSVVYRGYMLFTNACKKYGDYEVVTPQSQKIGGRLKTVVGKSEKVRPPATSSYVIPIINEQVCKCGMGDIGNYGHGI